MTNSEARNPHATPPTPDALDAAAIEATWLQQCGPCDAGLPMGCVCSDADPRPVIAALLAALDEARAEAERVRRGARTLGHIVETQGRDALDASGMHHVIGEDGDGDWAVVWEVLAELRPRAERAEARVTAAESARDAAEGAIERVENLIRERSYGVVFGGGITKPGVLIDELRAALAPVTTDETEGGGVDE